MAPIKTQQRRPHRQAAPGRRFTRSGPAPGRTSRGRRQPAPGPADKLIGLVRRALPGGDSGGKRTGSSIPLVGGLLGGKHGASAQRGRKPALVGLLGAGAAGAAVAAKRRRKSGSGPDTATHAAPDPHTAATSPPSSESPA